jgi:hypothetical protein
MLALMLCAVLAEMFQPGIITKAHVSLVARTDRNYKESPVTIFGQVFIYLFRIGTLGMAMTLCLYTGGQGSFFGFLALCGVAVVMLMLKLLCNLLLDYTFSVSRRVESPREHYANIADIAIAILYLVMLAMRRYGNNTAAIWAFWSVVLLFILMWTYRSWRLFVESPKDALDLLIYIGTLEVLPLAGLYYFSEKTIALL